MDTVLQQGKFADANIQQMNHMRLFLHVLTVVDISHQNGLALLEEI